MYHIRNDQGLGKADMPIKIDRKCRHHVSFCKHFQN